MKECKILHINDGRPRELSNGNWLFTEDYPRVEKILNRYLNHGYSVTSMVPLVTPGEPDGTGYAFYRSGYVFYLEREVEGAYTGPGPEVPICPEEEDPSDLFCSPDEMEIEDWFFDGDEEEDE